jgi:alcohol dehydrogenase (cytochrome c)
MAWYFQYTPNESWDYDEIGVHMLIDTEIGGETRKTVAHYARNGFFYQLDRTNGQFIQASQYVDQVTWTSGLDPKTGKPVEYDPALELQTYIPATRYDRGNPEGDICPTTVGGVRWQPPAYNPDRQIAYMMGGEGCNSIKVVAAEPVGPEGGNPMGVNQSFLGGESPFTAKTGMIVAIDVTTGQTVNKVPLDHHNLSGVLATSGGLLFTGLMDGTVAAYSDETLEQLWGFNTGIVLKAPPISYAIGDKQYIAIIAAAPGAPADASPTLDYMKAGASLYVFTL